MGLSYLSLTSGRALLAKDCSLNEPFKTGHLNQTIAPFAIPSRCSYVCGVPVSALPIHICTTPNNLTSKYLALDPISLKYNPRREKRGSCPS